MCAALQHEALLFLNPLFVGDFRAGTRPAKESKRFVIFT
jgi:hypothetical protein